MRATQKLREKLRTDVPQALSAALNSPLPRAVLQSRATRRSARRLLWILDRVDTERFVAKPMATLRQELRKLAGDEPPPQTERPSTSAGTRAESSRTGPSTDFGVYGGAPETGGPDTELVNGGGARDVTAAAGGPTDKPMPEMIRTTGGKRVPASVAHRAVAHSGVEFKPKKGKK